MDKNNAQPVHQGYQNGPWFLLAVDSTFQDRVSHCCSLKLKDRTSLPGMGVGLVPSNSICYLYRQRCENLLDQN